MVADVRLPEATAVSQEITADGGVAVAQQVDVGDFESVDDMVSTAEQNLGSIDVLVNNAGVGLAASVVETSVEDFDRLLAVNVKGVFYGAKAAIPRMTARGGGVIVNTASAAAFKGVRDRSAYITTKAAVVALTRAIALDHMSEGIRCNCVAPGNVDTPWIRSLLASSDDPVGARERMVARQPLGRLGNPEEIANAILYLASEEAAFMNGSCLVIDGGFSL
jgi:NAD(P)-dependent dehydrogenase (short-subunit alcohol dehydrogenase family)